MSTDVTLEHSPIPGLVVLRSPVHHDSRGWFLENWQRAKATAVGLPDFGPVQNNVSFNLERGTTRGIHAEPWDKLISVVAGRVFAAWVDLRAGASFGTTFSLELEPGIAVFTPRGVGNSYQTLEDHSVYSYLVNDHWHPGIAYPALHLGDPTAAIAWPIPLADAEVSDKDRANPYLDEITPVPGRKTLIIGNRGQLGRALSAVFPDADGVDLDELDLTNPTQVAAFAWGEYEVILNAAAYTAVDAAETAEGRVACWAANATAPATLARIAREHRQTLVHYSSDYVFDGTRETHTEDEPLSPLGVYGQSKAAGDLAVSGTPRHYLLRTSWVVGDGKNFVTTMNAWAREGLSPTVVDDQFGRLTFTSELARATQHLLKIDAAYGIYNATNAGRPRSWADWAKRVFELSGRSAADVSTTSTAAWAEGKTTSPRPRHSTMNLTKLSATGFVFHDVDEALEAYVRTL